MGACLGSRKSRPASFRAVRMCAPSPERFWLTPLERTVRNLQVRKVQEPLSFAKTLVNAAGKVAHIAPGLVIVMLLLAWRGRVKR